MPINLGLVLPAGPAKGAISRWQEDLDRSLPTLRQHFKGLWMTDHFFWGDEPTYEA